MIGFIMGMLMGSLVLIVVIAFAIPEALRIDEQRRQNRERANLIECKINKAEMNSIKMDLMQYKCGLTVLNSAFKKQQIEIESLRLALERRKYI